MADVLVVEDEPTVGRVLVDYLGQAGHTARLAADGRTALAEHAARPADLVLLDLMLPEVDGLTVLRTLREGGVGVPVIVLSARGTETERIVGLELGADDYVAKPASPREVVARVRAVLRRTIDQRSAQPCQAAGLVLDPTSRTASLHDRPLDLPPKEFDLLHHLVARSGIVCSRSELLAQVWGSSEAWQDPSTVTVHVRRLRRRIEVDPAEPQHLRTVYGKGYRFDP